MAQWFAGQFTQKVDGKGRVSIPADFRRVLESGNSECSDEKNPKFAIISGVDEAGSSTFLRRDYIESIPIDHYNSIIDWIRTQPHSAEKQARYLLYSRNAQRVTIDETGRIVISPKLRKQFGLEREAMFVSDGPTFQIWEPKAYEAHMRAMLISLEKSLSPDFDPSVTDSLIMQG